MKKIIPISLIVLILMIIFNLCAYAYEVTTYTGTGSGSARRAYFKRQFENSNTSNDVESNIVLGTTITFNSSLGAMGDNKIIDGKFNALNGNNNGGLRIATAGRTLTIKDATLMYMERAVYLNNSNSASNQIKMNGSGMLTFFNNYWTSNTDARGGAVRVEGNSDFSFSNGTLTFSGNSSTHNTYGGGGAVAVYGTNAQMNISDATAIFSGNHANGTDTSTTYAAGGGAIHINAGKMNVVNTNISFSNNSAVSAGGAIFLTKNTSILTFIGSRVVFSSNTADSGGGGAVELQEGAILNFNDSNVLFEYNKAALSNAGGALHVTGSTVNITAGRVEFKNNQAADNGGAMDLYDGTKFTVRNSSVSFENNSSLSKNAGAIYSGKGTSLSFNASTITFTGNNAKQSGGAMFLTSTATANFENSRIYAYGNSAEEYGGFLYLNGQRINFKNDEIYVVGSTAVSGGGIYAKSNSSVTFNNSNVKFEYNVAQATRSVDGGGGAIYSDNSEFYFQSSTVSFLGNAAKNHNSSGGAIYAGNSSLINFSNSNVLFANNTVNGGGSGAAIFMNSGKITFDNSDVTFRGNALSGSGSGGAIHFGGSKIGFTGGNILFSNNFAPNFGGAIYAASGAGLDFANNRSVIFSSNSANNGGAVYAMSGSTISFTNIDLLKFEHNKASLNGGALYFQSGSSATFAGSNIEAFNNSAIFGGFLYAHNFANIKFGNAGTVSLTSNTASGDGGAIYANSGAFLNFGGTATKISYNKAYNNGGGIFLNGSAAVDFSGTNLTATGNEAETGSGGFLYATSAGNINFKNMSLISNTALSDGGAIYANTGTTLVFNGSSTVISYNAARRSGGGIFLNESARADFSGANLTAIGNKAAAGGFLYSNDAGDIKFGNVKLISNTASNNGGAIYAASGTNLIFNGSATDINYNTATGNGGAIYAAPGTNLIFNGSATNINYNTATGNGGAIFLSGTAKANFENTNLEAIGNKAANGGFLYTNNAGDINFGRAGLRNNIASAAGGAIYANSGTKLIFKGAATTVSYNESGSNGGAIFLNTGAAADFSLTHLTAIGNRAVNGGFLYTNKNAGDIKFGNVNLISNTVSGDGGAIYADSGASLVFSGASSSVFNYNKASGHGGALFISSGSAASFLNASFKDNASLVHGGAIYVEGYQGGVSSVTFKTSSGKQTVFEGNKDSSGSNAVYAGNHSEIYFVTESGGNVEMYDAIAGIAQTAKFFFEGSGNFNLKKDSMANYADITINGGTFNLEDGADLRAGKFVNNSVLNMKDGQKNSVYAEDFTSNGDIHMDIFSFEDKSDEIIVNGGVNLNSSSNLTATMDNSSTDFRKKIYKLINYEGDLNGTFGSFDLYGISLSTDARYLGYGDVLSNWITLTLYGDRANTDFSSLKGISFNQKQTARVYDLFSGEAEGDLDYVISLIESEGNEALQKRALSQTAGYFLANVIRSGGADAGSDDLYHRIKSENETRNKGLWAQAKINVTTNKSDDNSLNDYTDTTAGAMIGYDMFLAEKNLLFGVYGKFNKHDISQDPNNSADVTNAGLGVYGGYVKDRWEIKGLLSGSIDSYETERCISFADNRKATADFSGMTLNADIEAALKMSLNEITKLRYYAGMEMRSSSYDEIKESGAQSLDLVVAEDNYQRTAGRLGIGINQEKQLFAWYFSGEYKILFNGNLPEIENKFAGTDEIFNVRGSEEGKGAIGFKAGGNIKLTENLKVFANGSYYTADKYNNLYGNLGLKWMFISVTEEDKAIKRKLKSETMRIKEEEKKLNTQIKENEKEIRSYEKEKMRAEKEEAKKAQAKQKEIDVQIRNNEKEKIKREKEEERKVKAKQKEMDSQMRAGEKETSLSEKEIMAIEKEEARKIKEEQKRIDAQIAAYEKEARLIKKKEIEEEKLKLAAEKAVEKEIKKKEKEEIRKAKEEEKQINAEISAYEKSIKQNEKEKQKAEKEQAKKAAAAVVPAPTPVSQPLLQEEKKKTDARILEYEIMLAAEQKKEEAKLKAEKEREREDLRRKQAQQAKAEEERRRKVSGEISDEELAKRKKEVESRMLKPILETFEVKFLQGSYDLTQHWKNELKKQCEAIKKYQYSRIIIEGHADAVEDTPKKASRLRAKAVYDEFINNGIPEEKISYVGLSSVLPAASNSSEAGRMANRRVVVVVE